MFNNKNNSVLLFFGLILLLSACQQIEAASSDDAQIAQVVQEGIIISPDVIEATQMAFTTVEAIEGRLTRQMSMPTQLHFPVTVDLSFERSGGRLNARHVSSMDFVQAGDVLLSIVFDEDALRVEEQQLQLRMREAERRHNSERTRRRGDIEQFRNQLHGDINEFEIEIHALRLESMEAEYQHIIHQFQISRREQSRQLQEIQERLLGEDIVAPFDAVVSWVNGARINSVVENWMIMVTLYDYNSFQLITRGAPDVFRFGDILTVRDRDGTPRAVQVVSDPLTSARDQSNQHEYILQPLDPDVTADYFHVNNLQSSPTIFDVKGILIPSRAIHIEEQQRFVYIYEDDVIRKRYIQAGLFYMEQTQILDGIEPGQLVVLH